MDLESLKITTLIQNELAKTSKVSKNAPSNSLAILESNLNSDAVKVEIGSSTTKIDLYKHINDVYDGKGYLSKNEAQTLNKEVANSFTSLSKDNPDLSGLYSGYMTAGFSYGIKARFANNISNTLKNTSNIRNAYFPEK